MIAPADLSWSPDDLIPAIVQDRRSGAVLMLAWMNRDALELTLESGVVHFWSRSRGELWRKGETSGNTLKAVSVTADCDGDTLLVQAEPAGPACHTGSETCWGPSRRAGFGTLDDLWNTIDARAATRPEGSYTARLLDEGPDLPARKVTEEAVEVLLAAKDHATGTADDARVGEEIADLIYHLLVLIRERQIDPSVVFEVLESRRR